MKARINIEETKKINKEFENVIKGKIIHEEINEEKESEEVYPADGDCGTCKFCNNDECERNNEYFYHDSHEGGIECEEYKYKYET